MMLETAIVYKDVSFRLRQRESQYQCLPNETDWEFAKKICEKLKLFYKPLKTFLAQSIQLQICSLEKFVKLS